MSLHRSKNTAIIHWYNALTSCNLTTIKELTDGKFFCNIINPVFNIPNADVPPELEKCRLDIEKETEDAKSELKDENDNIEYAMDQSEDAKESEGTRKVTKDASKESEDIQTESVNDGKKTDVFKKQSDDKNEFAYVPKSIIEPSESNTDDLKVTQRYEFLKNFIDGFYHIQSDKLINYPICKKSSEFELAKVAVFVLSAVVQQLMNSRNNQYKTLEVLDSKVQEDIKDCISLLITQGSNVVSHNDICNLLTHHANYTTSSPKKDFVSTPSHRNCSSKYKKRVGTCTQSPGEEFSNSPLKTFLESPMQRNQGLYSENKKLEAALNAEKNRSDDLKTEVDSLKMMLNLKDKEILDMQKEKKKLEKTKGNLEFKIEKLNTKHKGNKDAISNKYKKILQLKNKHIRNLEDADKMLHKDCEKQLSESTGINTRLNGKIKFFEEQFLYWKKVAELKEVENAKLQNEILELEASVKENFKKYVSLYDEKFAGLKAVKKEPESYAGECLRSVIEEDNEILREKLHTAEISEYPQKQTELDLKDVMASGIKKGLSHTEESAVMPDSLNIPVVTEIIKDCKLSTHLENSQRNGISPLDECDISSSSPNLASGEKSYRCNLRKKDETPLTEKQNDHVQGNDFGSLWTNCNDSGSGLENMDSVLISDSLIKLDLCKELGFNEAEYSAKLNVIKQLFKLLNEVFVQKGSNGSVSLTGLGNLKCYLKSHEDFVSCLKYIRESLFRFQEHYRDYSLSDEKQSNCDSTTKILKQLEKEKNKLQGKLSELEASLNGQIKEKEAKIDYLSKLADQLHQEKEQFSKVIEEMQHELNKLTSRDDEYKHIKNAYIKLRTENNEMNRKHNKQIKICREKIMSFEAAKKEFEGTIEKERRSRKRALSAIENLKFEITSQKMHRRCLEKELTDLKAEIASMSSCVPCVQKPQITLKRIYSENNRDGDTVISCSHNQLQLNAKQQSEKDSGLVMESRYKIELEVKEQHRAPEPEFIVPSISHAIEHEVKQDIGNESTLSGALFNKSLHSGLLLCTDDEEGFLNHSSIAEINRDYESEMCRVQELKRRNSQLPFHLQSSYPVEFQSTSPFGKYLYEHMKKKEKNVKVLDKNEKPQDSVKIEKEQIPFKKRKVTEVDNTSQVGPSKLLTTPDKKIRKTFKTPSSLRKLLLYPRRNQHLGTVRPKNP